MARETSRSSAVERRLLFLGGFPSGGTDLLKTVVNAHPEIELSGECPLLHQLLKTRFRPNTIIRTVDDLDELMAFVSKIDVWTNLSLSVRDRSEWCALLPMTVERLLFFGGEGIRIVGNKTPQNTENMLALRRLFPNSMFLIVSRDVRDVALSWKKKWGRDPYHCAARWASRMESFLEHRKQLPEKSVLVVKFEDLLDGPEKECRRICSFLGVPFSSNMLFHHQFVEQKIDGKLNYGEPLKAGNKEKWRRGLTPREVMSIEETAYDAMRRLKYTPEMAVRQRPLPLFRRFVGYGRDAAAMLFVGNREAQNNGFGKRLWTLGFSIRRRLHALRLSQ